MGDLPTGSEAALHREHDALARRLEVRPSVDEARHGIVLAFVGTLALFMSFALIFDRRAKAPSHLARAHPELFTVASLTLGALATVLLVRGASALRRSRRMAREEAALFERLRELRRGLGVDR